MMRRPQRLGVKRRQSEIFLPAEHAIGCRQYPLIGASRTAVCQANAIHRLPGKVDDRQCMLIEVVALEPPHYDEGIVTIHFEKLLTGEASEVNSVHAVFGGGFKQEKACCCAECDKLFHGGVPCLWHAIAFDTRLRR